MHQFFSRHKGTTAGFTLIELLIVIAIIGILASVIVASLNSAREKGRDAQRAQQAGQIAHALELYYSNNGSYPAHTPGANPFDPLNDAALQAALVSGTPSYLSRIPDDPIYTYTDSESYRYCTGNTASTRNYFVLLVNIEGDGLAGSDDDTYCHITRGPVTIFCQEERDELAPNACSGEF